MRKMMSIGHEGLEKMRVMALENFLRENSKSSINKGNRSQHDFVVESFCHIYIFKNYL